MYRPLIVLAAAVPLVAAAALLTPDTEAQSQTRAPASPPAASLSVVENCLRLAHADVDISDSRAFEKYKKDWRETCTAALAVEPDNPRVQEATARILFITDDEQGALALHRKAMAAGDAEAAHSIFELHKSFSRGDLTRVPRVTREEGERALRRAAELGHPDATMMLVALLDRGSVVKRDNAQAIYWAEKAVARPTKYNTAADMQVSLGRLLLKSSNPDQRGRGFALLEANINRYGAKTALAKAMRPTHPERARALLEEALRPDPGGAIPPLADMLIKGEGGSPDVKRGVRMLVYGPSDVPGVSLARGRLYAEGKHVERDIKKAIELIRHDAGWHHESRMELFELLAANPTIRIAYAGGLLYDAVEAAELGEPGGMASLIKIKLSDHVQFSDKAGGCAIAQKAAQAGDAEAAKLAEGCAK